MKYCIDTSSLMDAWSRWYPPGTFPSVWERLDSVIQKGDLISSQEVLREIERKDDTLYQWVKERQNCFMALTEEIQQQVRAILSEFPKLVDSRTGKSFADPFVVATAIVTGTVVVTGEKPTGKPNRPKIPEACERFRVGCINITEMFISENWKF